VTFGQDNFPCWSPPLTLPNKTYCKSTTSKEAFQQMHDRLQSLIRRVVDLNNEMHALTQDAVELYQAIGREYDARKIWPVI
jgi:hypothetical protein